MRILLMFLIVFGLGCNNLPEASSIGLKYYPSTRLLKSGLVWKYYLHSTELDRQTKTNILYIKMEMSDQVLLVEEYDAAFQLKFSYEIDIENHLWKLENQMFYNYRNFETIGYTENKLLIDENVLIDWLSNDALSDISNVIDGSGYRIINQQNGNVDSISGDKQIKTITAKRSVIRLVDHEITDTFIYNTSKVYEEDLGLTSRIRKSSDYTQKLELDELMTSEEFGIRSNHGTHRVGYIDTLMTLDDHTLFKPCDSVSKIADYYNDRQAEFKGGKGRLKAVLSEKLDPNILKGESGYLTYRFVINCEGEAGWFVTEEADLNYNKIQFGDETRMHLYHILKSEKEWTNLTIRNIPRDAYTYITFKIKDGELIEILP